MKTKAQYTVAARGVVFTPDAIITVQFSGGKTFTGPIESLASWVKENKVNQPMSCTTELGRHGIYPCIRATNERLAGALSVLAGSKLEVGDGITYVNRQMTMNAARTLMLAGYVFQPGDIAWGITELPYANAAKPAAQPRDMDAELELQLEDAPF